MGLAGEHFCIVMAAVFFLLLLVAQELLTKTFST